MANQRIRLALRGVLVVAALTLAGKTSAQPLDDTTKAAARDLAYEGVSLFEKGDHAAALDRLGRAYSILRAPSVGLWEARALANLGRLVEASERMLEVTRLPLDASAPEVQRKAQAEAAREREALLPRIAALVVTVAADTSEAHEVWIDGKPLPPALLGARIPVNPGAHRIEVRRGVEVAASEQVTLREGEVGQLKLTLKTAAAKAAPSAIPPPPPAVVASPTPPSPPPSGNSSSLRTVGWVAGGAGVVGLAVGGFFGVRTFTKKSARDKECDERGCSDRGLTLDGDARSAATTSTVAFSLGAVLTAAGGYLVLTSPVGPPKTGLRVSPAGSGLSVRGAF